MRQIRSPFGLRYIAETMNRYAGVARDLIMLFQVRFDPGRKVTPAERAEAESAIKTRIEGALANVQSLDEDRILRGYLNLITVTVRTNFFQGDKAGGFAPTLSLKLDSKLVEGSPEPRPFPGDLGLQPTRRRHPPAVRTDCARRHPLVRSRAGFPHRGPWPV